jgi:GAF domain-containing protein
MQQHRPDFDDLRFKINEVLQHSKQAEEVMVSVSAILNAEVDYYDWVGFYILDKASNELVLGPYIGAPTDQTHIPIGNDDVAFLEALAHRLSIYF